MKKRKLIQTQIDNKLVQFNNLEKVEVPPNGWIYSIRQGINMSLRQLGKKLSITPQSVKEIEERERTGAVSLKVLKQVASALDMHFVYGFIPKDKTLALMVERRAFELAKQIVERTSTQMILEDQKVDDKRLEQEVKEKAEELSKEIPSMLWD